jgi:hypothetical protein
MKLGILFQGHSALISQRVENSSSITKILLIKEAQLEPVNILN